MTQLELLAPARNVESGMAAIDHGADAVYIGASQFGARAAAGNTVADIARLSDYAHQFCAKVYVTVNTIVYGDELPSAVELLHELAEAGADAVLVQDMALVGHSPLPLHASTQTDNRTASKVAWLYRQGFNRVVLARELSAAEIAAIHQAVPQAELEVFVHGALCVSYSGLCYASQHCFNRSANRGRCAQFCRMKFNLVDADGHELQHDQHLLSLKDLNQSQYLSELISAGATSFKIEGRLKDIAYVKNVTAAYSQLLDVFINHHPDQYERASLGRCDYTFQPDLHKTFNRGYTTYFLHGRQSGMSSFTTPKSIGNQVDRVKNFDKTSIYIEGHSAFANGDGLCFFDDRRQLQGFRVNRVEGNRLFVLKVPDGLHVGTVLYRNNDQLLERQLSKPSAQRRIGVSFWLSASINENASTLLLRATDGRRDVTVSLPAELQPARTSQTELLRRELSRLGGTPFLLDQLHLPADFHWFVPASRLAKLRRLAVDAMLACPSSSGVQVQKESFSNKPATSPAKPPLYTYPFLYNVANSQARHFYRQHGIDVQPAFECHPPRTTVPLMQCRYCLRHALGHCTRHGGTPAPWHEPLFLQMGDGRRFRLEFDCLHCQMNVLNERN